MAVSFSLAGKVALVTGVVERVGVALEEREVRVHP